jgi:hypothetical protein
MTDRIRHVTVTLDKDYRDDDIEPVIEAIRMIKGVAEVEPRAVTLDEQLARAAVRSEIYERITDAVAIAFYPELHKGSPT